MHDKQAFPRNFHRREVGRSDLHHYQAKSVHRKSPRLGKLCKLLGCQCNKPQEHHGKDPLVLGEFLDHLDHNVSRPH